MKPRAFRLLGVLMLPDLPKQTEIGEPWTPSWTSNRATLPIFHVGQASGGKWFAFATWRRGLASATLDKRPSKRSACTALKNQVRSIAAQIMGLDLGGGHTLRLVAPKPAPAEPPPRARRLLGDFCPECRALPGAFCTDLRGEPRPIGHLLEVVP